MCIDLDIMAKLIESIASDGDIDVRKEAIFAVLNALDNANQEQV